MEMVGVLTDFHAKKNAHKKYKSEREMLGTHTHQAGKWGWLPEDRQNDGARLGRIVAQGRDDALQHNLALVLRESRGLGSRGLAHSGFSHM